jgi:hypothetical protein
VNEDDKKASRRAVLQAGVAVLAGAGLVTPAAAQQKIEKSLVLYQEKPKDGQQCSKCLQFQPPDACAIVEGKILPTGWCGAYAPKP